MSSLSPFKPKREAKRKAIRSEQFTSLTSAISAIECRISKDEGGRGIGDVVINGELLKAGRHIASMNKGETVVILSGCE